MKSLAETKTYISSIQNSNKISNALKPIKTELAF